MQYEFRIGDLVTVWTGGWDRRMIERYEGRAGIITRIASPPTAGAPDDYTSCCLEFGDGEIEVSITRIRLLTP